MYPFLRASLLITLLSIGFGGIARAQMGFGDYSVASKMRDPGGDIGIKLSDTTLLHVGVTAEAGYDTNVFYNEVAAQESAMLRVTPFFYLTNATRTGAARSGAHYDLGTSLVYREYLNDDSNVKAQRAFNPTFFGNLVLSANRAFSFSLGDQFSRIEEAPYTAGSPTIVRDYNLGNAQLRMVPGGGRIQAVIRYTNTLEYYETASLKESSNMGHDLMLDMHWSWLPKTAIFVQVGGGMVGYLYDPAPGSTTPPRQGSYNYRASGGIRGLVTPKTSVNLNLGYADAAYDAGPSPAGLSTFVVGADFVYLPTILTKLGLSYVRGFRNSPVIGNFYNVDAGQISASQLLGRVTIELLGRYEYRRYQGVDAVGAPLGRKDHVVTSGAQLDYFLQRWFYAGVGYALTFNESNAAQTVASAGLGGASYVKHEILGRIGVLY